MASKSKRCHAFTLVELLLVIGIIVLLMMILIPVLGRAREAGRRIVCSSNLRQIGLAVIQYRDQWDQYPVCTMYWTTAVPVRQLDIQFVLTSYLENLDIFKCPSDTRNRNKVGWFDTFGNSYMWHNTYSNLTKGLKIGYLHHYDADGKLTNYKIPMVNDVVPNHQNLQDAQWPAKNICDFVGGGCSIDPWLKENQDAIAGFNSVWPDGHVEKGLGSDYIRYLKDTR